MVDYAFNYLLNSRPETMEERSYPTAAPLGLVTVGIWAFGLGVMTLLVRFAIPIEMNFQSDVPPQMPRPVKVHSV